MRLAVLVLALAPLATTRAEVVHILEDFSDAQRFFTDAGASLGPGFWDSGAMNATTTEEGALRVDYETWWAQLYGYVQFGRILDDYYPCADATHLSAVTRCGRRAAAGEAAHLVGAARAQVVPPDEQHARRGLSAHIAPAAGRLHPSPFP